MSQLKAFCTSAEHRPLIKLRNKAARSSLMAVEGV